MYKVKVKYWHIGHGTPDPIDIRTIKITNIVQCSIYSSINFHNTGYLRCQYAHFYEYFGGFFHALAIAITQKKTDWQPNELETASIFRIHSFFFGSFSCSGPLTMINSLLSGIEFDDEIKNHM